jgi:hypothetical protein
MLSLDAVERALESLVERLFAADREGLEPLEIARALRRALEDSARAGPARTYAANTYEVTLSPADWQEWRAFEAVVVGELETYLDELAVELGYTMGGRPRVRLMASENVGRGQFRVEALVEPGGSQTWLRLLTGTEAGRLWDVQGQTVLGRGPAAEVYLDHESVSRTHAKIQRRGDHYTIIDLHSTNGTLVEGRKVVTETPLHNGAVIRLGRMELLFRTRAEQGA